MENERNVLRRLNRYLSRTAELIRKTRGESSRLEMGDYYCVDLRTNTIIATHVNLETFLDDGGLMPGTCCLCHNEIPLAPGGDWLDSRNAQPLADGRCCPECDANLVIPARMREHTAIVGTEQKTNWTDEGF